MCKGINKGCDYIVYSEINEKHYIFFIECKSDKPDNNEVRKQLINATYFIEYLTKLIKYHYGKNIDFKKKINVLFFTPKTVRKSTINNGFKHVPHRNIDFIKRSNYQKKSGNILNLNIIDLVKSWNKR